MKPRDQLAWIIFLVAAVLHFSGWNPVTPAKPPLIAGQGLHIGFITDRLSTNPADKARNGIPSEEAMRAYCDQFTSKDAAGQPNWRLIDKADDLNTLPPDWKLIAAEGLKASPPSVVAANGPKWQAITLPNTEKEVEAFLNNYR